MKQLYLYFFCKASSSSLLMAGFLLLTTSVYQGLMCMESCIATEEVVRIQAQYNVGEMLAAGRGTANNEKREEEAKVYFKKVAAQDQDKELCVWACLWLAKICRETQENSQADAYLEKASGLLTYLTHVPLVQQLVHLLKSDKRGFLLYLAAQNIFFSAAEEGSLRAIEFLIGLGADINARDKNNQGNTGLHLAVWKGHKDIVELLLSRGADFEASVNDGTRALHIAVVKGHKDIAELLLSRGADFEAEDKSLETMFSEDEPKLEGGYHPLHLAVLFSCSKEEMVKLLLSKGADIEAEGDLGLRALHIAAVEGDEDVVELLLSKGANLEATTKDGSRALHLAAMHGCRKEVMVELLLSKGADLEAEDHEGKRAIDYMPSLSKKLNE